MRVRDFQWAGLSLPWLSAFVVLSLAAIAPLWLVDHPPLQDLPQHLAAIQVLKSYPELSLGKYFELAPLRTQYLGYYSAAWLLSHVLGVELANRVLLSLAIVALPWSIVYLLRALGRDPRPALLAFSLTYNAHLILGFFNFIAALPLMFAGLASAVMLRREPSVRRELAFALLLVVCFFTHVVPFAFLGVGATLLLIGGGVRATALRARAFLPALLVCALWLWLTPAGQATLSAAGAKDGSATAEYLPFDEAVREIPMWLTDVLYSPRDEQLLDVWYLLLLSAIVWGVVGRRGASSSEPLTVSFARRLWLLAPLALMAYFVSPMAYDWIWPIAARFPVICLLFALLYVRGLPGKVGDALCGAFCVLGLVGFVETTRAFIAFDREEVGAIDRAIAVIPEGERVAGLIFERGSRYVKFSPFIHYAALYQAEKGGVVMFTFADFPQSPFLFREDARPPRVPPRWEWMPERVNPERDLAFYSYVFTRGGPGIIGMQDHLFEPIFNEGGYAVFRRR
jgi:hypothetical protein